MTCTNTIPDPTAFAWSGAAVDLSGRWTLAASGARREHYLVEASEDPTVPVLMFADDGTGCFANWDGPLQEMWLTMCGSMSVSYSESAADIKAYYYGVRVAHIVPTGADTFNWVRS